jgi:hypothetical protein
MEVGFKTALKNTHVRTPQLLPILKMTNAIVSAMGHSIAFFVPTLGGDRATQRQNGHCRFHERPLTMETGQYLKSAQYAGFIDSIRRQAFSK